MAKKIEQLQIDTKAIGKQTAYRAVANANAANHLAIIIPCHRVINSNGQLGGYSAGVERKKWLIEHEKYHGREKCKNLNGSS